MSSGAARTRVHEILEATRAGDRTSRAVHAGILALITLNVVAIVLETVEPMHRAVPGLFRVFEVISVAAFSAEYALRVWSCVEDERFRRPVAGRLRFAATPMAIVDLLSVLPFYVALCQVPGKLDLRFIRALRLFRLFRIAKLGRYSEAMQVLRQAFRSKKEELVLSFSVLVLLLVAASSLMYYAEHGARSPDPFPSIPAAMWWAVVTLTTVGYGDVYPVTVYGKIVAGVVAVLGIGMFALPTGILGAGLVEEARRRKAAKVCPHCGKKITEDE